MSLAGLGLAALAVEWTLSRPINDRPAGSARIAPRIFSAVRGLARTAAALLMASNLVAPASCSLRANSTIRMAFFEIRPTSTAHNRSPQNSHTESLSRPPSIHSPRRQTRCPVSRNLMNPG